MSNKQLPDRSSVIGNYAIIIGAMKSGTTTLHQRMSSHPEIAASTPKELNFFCHRYKPEIQAYEDRFRFDSGRHVYTLESSPNYTKLPRWRHVPARIARLPGRKRLIYILRNPIDRIDSHIAHNIAKGRLPNARVRGPEIGDLAISVSSYAKQIKEYEDAGLLSDMLLVDFVELSESPQTLVDKICDFLGVARFTAPDMDALNTRRLAQTFLTDEAHEYCRAALRPDVQALIDRYQFVPARAWGIV
jgi:Sulfotransferase domain